jgi:putative transposase
VEEDPYLWAVIRYIELNPVRANLAKKSKDYQWSSARAHILGAKDDILSKESCFDDIEIKAYREYLSKDAKEINASIRRTTSTGRPLGSESFIKELEKALKRDLSLKRLGVLRRKTMNIREVELV